MKTPRLAPIAACIALTLTSLSRSDAQEAVMRRDSIYSQILKEQRPLEVLYPKDYKPDLPGGYDVLYVTDGISDYLRNEWGWLQWEGFIPKNMIVVGVPNTVHEGVDTRERDFTPTRVNGVSGEAAKFLAFFKQELLPYVAKTYPTKTSGNTLFGSSLGGLFVVYAFLHDPTLFTSYVAVDPSLWWDDFHLNKVAPDRLRAMKTLNQTLYVAGRTGQPSREMGVHQLDSLLHRRSPPGLRWTVARLSNETHYSTMLKGIWDGLKFSYGGYYASTGGYYSSRNIDCRPLNGAVLRNKPFSLSCFNLMAEDYLRYTTDGSEPTLSSGKVGYRTAITLSHDAVVTVKSIGVRDEYNRTGTFRFKVVDSFPSQFIPRAARAGGLRFDCYAAATESLADVDRAAPKRSGFADSSFSVTQLVGDSSRACILTGYLRVPKAGYYIFSMGESDNDSRMLINDQVVLGNHQKPGVGENYLLPMGRGFYAVRIEYLRRRGRPELVPIYVEGEDGRQFPVPASWFYGVPES